MYQINLTLTETKDTIFTIPDFEAKDKDEAQTITYSIESGNCLVRQRTGVTMLRLDLNIYLNCRKNIYQTRAIS